MIFENGLYQRLTAVLSRRSGNARRFGVAASTAIKWVDQWRRTGDAGPRPQGGDHRSHRIEAHAEEILALVNEMPDITLGEIAAQLDAGHGLTVAQSTVWRLLDRARHDLQKKPRTRPSNQRADESCTADRPGSTPSRGIWSPSGWCSLTRPALRPRWHRRHGRSQLRGERCRAPVPHGHWKTISPLLRALRLEGMTAPMVLDGAFARCRLPRLCGAGLGPDTLKPGEIVVMDNLPAFVTNPSPCARCHRSRRGGATLPAALQP